MTLRTNNAEGGTLGATVTTGNSGGASGNAWSRVDIGSACTQTYDNTHAFGTRSLKMVSPGGLAETYHVHNWWYVSTTTVGYGRVYVWLDHWPVGGSIMITSALLNDSRTFAISVSTSGKVELRDRDNDVVVRSSGSVATGQWTRIEWFCRTSGGKRLEARFFNNATSTVMSGNVVSTSLAMTSSMNQPTYGNASYVGPMTIWLDQFGFSTTGWMGPVYNTVSLGQAVETDTAQTWTNPIHKLDQAVETDTAMEVRPARAFPVAQAAAEIDTAEAVTPFHLAWLPQAVEADTAGTITPFLYGPGWNPKVIEIRLFDDAGNQDKFVPDWTKIDFTSIFSSDGVVTVEYPPDGLNYAELATPDTEGALFLNNVEVDGSRFIVSEKTGDVIKPDATSSIQGKTWVTRLNEILVYPPSWPLTDPKDYTFTNATVGEIMSALLLAGQDRNVDAALKTTWTFTNGAGSNGTAWDKQATMTFKAGTNLLDILKSLTKLGMCDFTTKGRELYVTNAGEIGTDRTGGTNPVVLFKGRDFSDAPVNWSTKDLLSVVLVEGDDGTLTEVVDSAAVTQWARREGYASQSGITDLTTLGIVGQATIDINDHQREERSHELTFDTSGFLALWDYFVGDTIAVDTDGSQGFYRVMQIRITWSDSGEQTGGITLNDRFEDLAVKLQQQIDNFTGVAVSTAPGPGPDGPDTRIPKAPAGVAASPSVYQVAGGLPFVQYVVSWTAVTQNTDDSAITDLSFYEVQSKPTSSAFWGPSQSSDADTHLFMYGFTSGISYDFRVRAVDESGNRSAWSATVTSVAPFDTVPPSSPSMPTVDSYLGTLRISWDGTDDVGAGMPDDFKHVEVHVSAVNDFTPSESTVVDYLPAAGKSVVSGLTYGTPYYAKLVAVDTSGNRSTPSEQASGTPTQVVGTDVGGNVIGLDNIQFKDFTNLIPDGSFEIAERRVALSTHSTAGAWEFVNTGADHGVWAVRCDVDAGPAATFKQLYLLPASEFSEEQVPFGPDRKLYTRVRYKADTGTTGTCALVVRFKKQDGSDAWGGTSAGNIVDGTWHTAEGYVTPPSDTVSWTSYLEVSSDATSGVWYFDRAEVREVIDSIIIADAAITSAKIANLAVGDAQIGSVSAGKITAGSLVADVLLGARIKTADAGARVELNSAGLKAFDGAGTQTVSVNASDGSVDIVGQFLSGVTGSRVVMNPEGATSPEIRFYPTTGANYARIYSIPKADEPSEVELYIQAGVNAEGTARGLVSVRSGVTALQIFDSTGNNNGAYFWASESALQMGFAIGSTFYGVQTLNNVGFWTNDGKWKHSGVQPGVLVGKIEVTGNVGGFTQNFGPTFISAPWLNITTKYGSYRGANFSSISTTEMQVTLSSGTTTACTFYYSGYRGE